MRSTLVGIALAAIGLTACAAPLNQYGPAENMAYALDAIDDRPLPYAQIYGTAPARQEVVNGMLLLRQNGTFLMDLTYFTATADGPSHSSRVWDGTWRRSGNTFFFYFDNGGRNTAVLVDGRLQMQGEASRFTWAR